MRVRVAVCLACLAWAELLRPTPGGAQQSTGDLAGRVVDANDRPVPDARVIIVGLVATITDSAGGFAFTGLESETLLLRVEKLGYGLATRTIVFWADSAQSEVYKTASATPLEYRSIKVSCGTVVLWTH